MKIGITGAAGFIGAALATRLAAEGHTVVGLDLTAAGAGHFRGLGGEYHTGDVTDVSAVERFCRGLDRIYHTAAIVKEAGDWDVFRRVNVTGAATVARCAREAGAREFVHFSSVMVYGFDFPEGVAEAGPLDGCGNPYCTTKIESEAAVLAAHRPGEFDVYIVRPGDVYGPGSIPWTVRPVDMMRRRRWVYVDSRRSVFNHVYVDNLLDGIALILSRRASGRPFAITDDRRTTVREFFGRYQRWLGIRYLPEVPAGAALTLGGVLDRLAGPLGIELEVNREAVRYMLRRAQYGIEAIRLLGYRPAVSLDEGMERTRSWLAQTGRIPL